MRDEFTRQSGWFEVDWSARSSLSNEQIMQFVLGATKATLGRGGGSVLDVCTGTGVFARALAKDGSFNSITGIDITPAMLDEARRNADHERLHRLQFLSGDATALPFENNSFDAAVTRLAVHHLSEPALALKEMARVVKPGGHVVVVDIVVGGNDVGELCTDSDGGADPALALETNRLERLRDPSHTSMLSRSEICSLLEECGLTPTHTAENTPMLANLMNMRAWMDATQTKPHAVQQIERSVKIELEEGGTRTGMGPLVGDDGEIWFTHHYAVFQAFKPAATSEPSSGEVNRKLDWGLAEDGNRSNIVSAGAGTESANLQSTRPEMPEQAWRKLATH